MKAVSMLDVFRVVEYGMAFESSGARVCLFFLLLVPRI